MENASKALLMAASVLVGVMILSLGVYLFSTYAEYSSEAYKKMEDTQIDKFNAQFLKYYGIDSSESSAEQRIKCTAHDIITLVNLAQQNNKYYEIESLSRYDETTSYIQVDLGTAYRNLEKWDNERKIEFIKNNATHLLPVIQDDGTTKQERQTKYYYITDSPVISSYTKRVCYINFKEF